jgi:putative tryptophan/tyrosine transport system substrate-binding protein
MRFNQLGRREFIGLVGGAAVAWPLKGRAQKAPTRIGFLASGAVDSPFLAYKIDLLKQGLGDNGLIEGRDYVLEVRYAAGNYGRFPELARELVNAGVSVVIANTPASVLAAQRLEPPVPVVMVALNDPVRAGLVESLAHPGGYTTGTSNLNPDLTSKTLEFVRTILPKATIIAALINPQNPTHSAVLDNLRAQAGVLGIAVVSFELESDEALNAVFSSIAERHPDALQIVSDSGFLDLSDRIAAQALAHRLPTFTSSPSFVKFGGLMAYGAVIEPLWIRSGYFVKRIINGTKPADLPVEQPTRIELSINLKTAKALGLSVPETLLARANEVIE